MTKPDPHLNLRSRQTGSVPVDIPHLKTVLENGTRDGWRKNANCRGADTNIFFPEQGGDFTQAVAVCDGCAVRYDCLAEHLYERDGFWGGASEFRRRAIRKRVTVHGELATYNAGCRCSSCKHVAALQYSDVDMRSCYVGAGCRCELCRASNAAYVRERREATAL